jgi:metal-responsive CopG/Arc/MetJ family transcriptional regulator
MRRIYKRKTKRGPTAQISLRLPVDLLTRLDEVADEEERSRTKVVEILVREALERRQERL